MSKIVFFEFAGRRANMVVQRPHVERLLAQYPDSEFHLWDLTRDPADAGYIRDWARAHEQVFVFDHLHPGHPIRHEWRRTPGRPLRCVSGACMIHRPPYEDVWREYAAHPDGYQDATFVKFDDDVIWMDTDRFGEVLEFLETSPGRIASANVTNNSVCGKYDSEVQRAYHPLNTTAAHDLAWWALHTDADFAKISHGLLLEDLSVRDCLTASEKPGFWVDRQPFRTRIGENISINFVAMKYPMLVKAARRMVPPLGDEGAVDTLLPWIIPNFRVAHLSFGPQEKAIPESTLDYIREQYAEFS